MNEPRLTSDPQFEALLRQVAAVSLTPHAAEAPPLELGTTLGGYRLLERVGAGGMGVVYRAFDTRLDREVALKVLAIASTEETGGQTVLLEEARRAAALTHPNLASVYEAGLVDGVAFFAMELVRGTSLRTVCAERAGSFASRVALAKGVARALEALHDAGLIHCDVKPENVMVTQDGTAKLLDFGLARPTNAPDAPRFAGTPRYMPPEQRRGEPLEASADVYSFGRMLEELHPQEGGRALQRLIRACTASNPRVRPTAREVLAALEALGTPRTGLRTALLVFFAAAGIAALWLSSRPTPVPPPRRLTGLGANHPVSDAALSLDGQTYALIDDQGLSVGPVAAPERAAPIALSEQALAVEPAGVGFHVTTRAAGAQASVWHVTAGAPAQLRYRGTFKHASLTTDGSTLVAIEGHRVVVRRVSDGAEVSSVSHDSATALHGVRWALDGTSVYALSSSELVNGERLRTLEIWSAGATSATWRLQSHRLSQGYVPVVFGWSARGPLLYAFSDEPGQGAGSSVWHRSRGSPSLVSTVEGQFVAAVGQGTDGTLLTVRERTRRRVYLSNVSQGGAPGAPVALTESQLDERPSSWQSPRKLLLMSLRDLVPHLARRNLDLSRTEWLDAAGWAQTWPVSVGNGGAFLYWWADAPTADEVPSWHLALRSADGGDRELTLPKPALGRVSTFSAPPHNQRLRCSGDRCVLAISTGSGLAFWSLELPSGRLTERLQVDGQFSVSAWSLSPSGALAVVDSTSIRVFDGQSPSRLVAVPDLVEVRAVAFDQQGTGFYVAGLRANGDQLVGWLNATGQLSMVRQSASAFGDLLLSPDGAHLAFLEREFDADLWVTPLD